MMDSPIPDIISLVERICTRTEVIDILQYIVKDLLVLYPSAYYSRISLLDVDTFVLSHSTTTIPSTVNPDRTPNNSSETGTDGYFRPGCTVLAPIKEYSNNSSSRTLSNGSAILSTTTKNKQVEENTSIGINVSSATKSAAVAQVCVVARASHYRTPKSSENGSAATSVSHEPLIEDVHEIVDASSLIRRVCTNTNASSMVIDYNTVHKDKIDAIGLALRNSENIPIAVIEIHFQPLLAHFSSSTTNIIHHTIPSSSSSSSSSSDGTNISTSPTVTVSTINTNLITHYTRLVTPSLERLLRAASVTRMKRRNEQLMALTRRSSAAGTTGRLVNVVDAVLDATYTLLEAARVTLFLVDEGRQNLVIASSGEAHARGMAIPMHSGLAGYTARTGETVWVDDAYLDPRFNPAMDATTTVRTHSLIAAAITDASGEIIGVLQAVNRKTHAESPFSHHHHFAPVTETENSIDTNDNNINTVSSTSSSSSTSSTPHLAHLHTGNHHASHAHTSHHHTVASMTQVWPFVASDVDILEGMAAHAAVALRTVQILEETTRAKRTAAALMEIVQASASASGMISTSTGSKNSSTVPSTNMLSSPTGSMLGSSGGNATSGVALLVQRIIDAAYALFDCERVTLFLVDPVKNELWMAVTKDPSAAGVRIPVGKGLAGFVAATGIPLNIEDAYTDPQFDRTLDAATGFHTQSVLVWPVCVGPLVSAAVRSTTVVPLVDIHGKLSLPLATSNNTPIAILQAINKHTHALTRAASLRMLRPRRSSLTDSTVLHSSLANTLPTPLIHPHGPVRSVTHTPKNHSESLVSLSSTPLHRSITSASSGNLAQPIVKHGSFDRNDEKAMSVFCAEVAVALKRRSAEAAFLKAVADATASVSSSRSASFSGTENLEILSDINKITHNENSSSLTSGPSSGNLNNGTGNETNLLSPGNFVLNHSNSNGSSSNNSSTSNLLQNSNLTNTHSNLENPAAADVNISLLSQYADADTSLRLQSQVLTRPPLNSTNNFPMTPMLSNASAKSGFGGNDSTINNSATDPGSSASVPNSVPMVPPSPFPLIHSPISTNAPASTSFYAAVSSTPISSTLFRSLNENVSDTPSVPNGKVTSTTGADGMSTTDASTKNGHTSEAPSTITEHNSAASQWTTTISTSFISTSPPSVTVKEAVYDPTDALFAPLLASEYGSIIKYKSSINANDLVSWKWNIFSYSLLDTPARIPAPYELADSNAFTGLTDELTIGITNPPSYSAENTTTVPENIQRAIGELRLQNCIYTIFQHYHLLSRFNINDTSFCKFSQAVRNKYHPNPFHNWYHAVSVLHGVFVLMGKTVANSYLNYRDLLAAFVAALGHDIDHPGNNNAYEISTYSPLAVMHNDDAVLERHHAATLWKVLSDPQIALFNHLPAADVRELRKTIVYAILHTDMSKHFTSVSELAERAARYQAAVKTSLAENGKLKHTYSTDSNKTPRSKYNHTHQLKHHNSVSSEGTVGSIGILHTIRQQYDNEFRNEKVATPLEKEKDGGNNTHGNGTTILGTSEASKDSVDEEDNASEITPSDDDGDSSASETDNSTFCRVEQAKVNALLLQENSVHDNTTDNDDDEDDGFGDNSEIHVVTGDNLDDNISTPTVSQLSVTGSIMKPNTPRSANSRSQHSLGSSKKTNSVRIVTPPSSSSLIDSDGTTTCNDTAMSLTLPTPFDRNNDTDRLELVALLVHTGDLSGQAYHVDISLNWSSRIMAEFESQANKERARNLPVAPFMAGLDNRLQACRLQLSFISNIVTPLWKLVAELLPGLDEPLDNLKKGREYYENEVVNIERNNNVLLNNS